MIINEKDYVQGIEIEVIRSKRGGNDIWRGLHYYEDFYIENGVKHPFSDAPEYIQERKRRYDEQCRKIEEERKKEDRRQRLAAPIGALIAFLLIGCPFIYAAATDQWLAPFIIIGIFVMLFGSIFGIGIGLPGD